MNAVLRRSSCCRVPRKTCLPAAGDAAPRLAREKKNAVATTVERGARQPHGMKFGQRSLKHIGRTAPLVRGAQPPHRMSARSKRINRTARRRQRPWLHDRAALAPVRGLRGERLAQRGGSQVWGQTTSGRAFLNRTKRKMFRSTEKRILHLLGE